MLMYLLSADSQHQMLLLENQEQPFHAAAVAAVATVDDSNSSNALEDNSTFNAYKQLCDGDGAWYSVARLRRGKTGKNYGVLELHLFSQDGQQPQEACGRMKVTCNKWWGPNLMFAEILTSVTGSYFDQRWFPRAYGRLYKLENLKANSRENSTVNDIEHVRLSNDVLPSCVWKYVNTSFVGGAVMPFYKNVKETTDCDQVMEDAHGVALQWLLDLLTGNNDRGCKHNVFHDGQHMISLDNDRLPLNRPHFCSPKSFPQLLNPFFLRPKLFKKARISEDKEYFCRISRSLLNIMSRMKLASLKLHVLDRLMSDQWFNEFIPLRYHWPVKSANWTKSMHDTPTKTIVEKALKHSISESCLVPNLRYNGDLPYLVASTLANVVAKRSKSLHQSLKHLVSTRCKQARH